MIENVGTVQAIYTVEPDPEDDERVVVTYWLQNGQKLGQTTVRRG